MALLHNWKLIGGIHNGCWVNSKHQKTAKCYVEAILNIIILNCNYACWTKGINGKKNQHVQLAGFKKQQQITMDTESKCV